MASHEDFCKICKFGAHNIDWVSSSNCAISRMVDCSESSVRRHKGWARANGFELGETSTVTHGFPDTGVPGTWVPRRHWQTPTGEPLSSFQFVPDGTDEETHVDNERIDSLIRAVPDPVFPDVGEGFTEILDIADPQLGKAGEALGGTAGTIERIYAGVQKAIETRYLLSPPRQIVLVDGGDIIENCFSTPQQIASNDRTLPEQIEDAVAVYVNVIGMLLPYTGSLVYVAVPSNHGEARTAMKVNPYDSDNDWGLMIQRLVRTRCEDRGWDVQFVCPEPTEDTAVLTTVDGTKLAFNHGHHCGTPANVKKWVIGQIVGRRPGWDADVWMLHHFHHAYFLPVGNGVTVFGTPSVDPGSAWFTKKTGESNRPGLTSLTVNQGDWSNYSVC